MPTEFEGLFPKSRVREWRSGSEPPSLPYCIKGVSYFAMIPNVRNEYGLVQKETLVDTVGKVQII